MESEESLLLKRLAAIAPAFEVAAGRVHFIQEGPTGFYQSILKDILAAERRVILASLYIGNGPLERELVCTCILSIVIDYGTLHLSGLD